MNLMRSIHIKLLYIASPLSIVSTSVFRGTAFHVQLQSCKDVGKVYSRNTLSDSQRFLPYSARVGIFGLRSDLSRCSGLSSSNINIRPSFQTRLFSQRATTTAATDPAILQALRQELIFEYDTTKYPFREAVCAVLGLSDMDTIHSREPEWHVDGSGNRVNRLQVRWNADRDRSGRYQDDRAYAAFDDVYKAFIAEVVAPGLGGGRVLFQRAPTLRVLSPISPTGPPLGVMSRLHCDMDYHHQPSELNYWLPLTAVFGTNSLWVESAPGRADYHPLTMLYGQCCRFYGNQCRHETRPNDSGHTRVSLDFRAVSESSGGHDPEFRAGVRRGAKARFQTRFDVGGFYSECHVPPGPVTAAGGPGAPAPGRS